MPCAPKALDGAAGRVFRTARHQSRRRKVNSRFVPQVHHSLVRPALALRACNAALCLAIILMVAVPVRAAQSLTAVAFWSHPMRETVRQLLTGDVDGDGQGEIVVVGRNGYLAVLEADGKVAWQSSLGEEVYVAELADLTGDSAKELLVGGPRGVTALRGNGSSLWFYRTGYAVDAIFAGTMQSDGHAEVVVATGSEHVYRLTSEGKALWHYWPQPQDSTGTVTGLAVADVDGDAQAEVALAFASFDEQGLPLSGWIRLLDDNGEQLWLRRQHSAVLSIAAYDPDGWGRYVIAAGTSAGELLILYADNSLRWEQQLESPVIQLLAGDLDGDQQDEIVAIGERRFAALEDDGSLLWSRSAPDRRAVDAALGNAEGSAGRPVAVLSSYPGVRRSVVELIDIRGDIEESYALPTSAALVAFSDLNLDDWGDLLLCTTDSVQMISRARGAARSRLIWSYSVQGEVIALDAADVDADGHFEILVGSLDQNVYVLKDDGSLSWRYPAPGAVQTVNTGDVDRDGQLEVIVGYNKLDERGDSLGWGLSILRGDGRALWQYQMDNRLWAVHPADVNADGKQDVVAGTGSNQISAISDGHLLWSYRTLGSVVSLFAADLNGSGQAGIVAGSEDNRAYVLFGRGMLRWSYDTGRDVVAVCATDLNSDTLSEPVVASAQGMIYAFRLGGEPLWRYDLNDTPLAVYANDADSSRIQIAAITRGGEIVMLGNTGLPAWQYTLRARLLCAHLGDVDGDRDPEVIVGSTDGVLYTVAKGARLESRHELGEAITAIWSGDVDGNGRAEIVAGTSDGQIAMYGHTPNRPPLIANPSIASAETGYIYSLSVNDAENDQVDVILEVMDPSTGTWRSVGTKSVNKPGSVYWLVDRFPLLASGRIASYRLIYSDGLNSGTVGPMLGPRIPGISWYTYALLAAAMGLLVLSYRAWHRSPTRWARVLYNRLAKRPQDMPSAMRRLVDRGTAPTETLIRLSHRARERGDQTMASLAEGYLLLSSSPPTGLRVIASALNQAEPGSGAGQNDVSPMVLAYELLADLLEARSVARIAVLRPRIQRVLGVHRKSEPDAGHDQAIPDELLDALAQLLQVARLVRSSERVEAPDDRLAYLSEASETLSSLAPPDDAARKRGKRIALETAIVPQIAASWQRAIAAAREEWLGRAQLRCRLRTKRIVTTGETLLVLEVLNKGRSPALQTTVELLADETYRVLEAPVFLGNLPPRHAREARVRMIPPAGDHFRAEFVLRYDDREAPGKSQLFADMVEVLSPSEFHEISNPYVPGRPLRPASPMFFGRDEAFKFIASNVRGLLQRNILILIGQRRTGKTSMLLQLPLHLGPQYIPVYLDCQSLGVTPGLAAWLYDAATAIAEVLSERGLQQPVPDLTAFEQQPARVFEHDFLEPVQQALEDRTLLLVLDEFEELEMRVRSGRLDPTMFSYLRHLMQHAHQVAFVFVGTHRLEEMSTDYWSVLFNIALYRHIGYLDERSARRLIIEPVQPYNMVYDDLALHRMLQVTAGHPYFLQLLCYSLVNSHNRSGRNYTTIDDVDQALDEILTLGEAHFAFLWDRSTDGERVALLALTRLLPRLGLAAWPQVGATASDVALLLADQGLIVDPKDISNALRNLAKREILQETAGDIERYGFKVGLVALWVERYKSLPRVLEDLMSPKPNQGIPSKADSAPADTANAAAGPV